MKEGAEFDTARNIGGGRKMEIGTGRAGTQGGRFGAGVLTGVLVTVLLSAGMGNLASVSNIRGEIIHRRDCVRSRRE